MYITKSLHQCMPCGPSVALAGEEIIPTATFVSAAELTVQPAAVVETHGRKSPVQLLGQCMHRPSVSVTTARFIK